MRRVFSLIAAFTVVSFLGSCSTGPDYSTPEAFLRDFVKALSEEQTGRFESFYLQESDFNMEAPAADLAVDRFMGTVREEFLQRCRGAAAFMRGKKVLVDNIEFRTFEPRIVQFLSNVKENHSGTLIHLAIGTQKARIEVDELIQIGEEWRLTQFLLIIEEEAEWGGEIEIDASKSKVKHGEVVQEDAEEEDDEDGEEEK